MAYMKRGYMRVSKATPAAPQEAALQAAGLSDFSEHGDVWRDEEPKRRPKEGAPPQPWRDKVVSGARAGDEVVIATLEVWSPSLADGIAALNALAAKGGVLRVLEPPAVYQGGPALAEAVAFVRAMEAAMNAAKARPAQQAAAERIERNALKDAKARKEAKALWFNLDMTAEEVAARTAYSERTMYRWWGPRTPLVPTRKLTRRK